MKIESKKIRDAAAGQACTLQIVGHCNYDTTTTILAHLPDESHGGARKSDDISACFACSSCHDLIDGRVPDASLTREEREWYMRRAMVRTWRRLIEMELITIAGFTA